MRGTKTAAPDIWRPWRKFTDNRHRATSEVRTRFQDGLFSGPLPGPKGKSPLRAPHRAETIVELLRLYLLFFRKRGVPRSEHPQHRSFQKISGARTREFCAEQPADAGPSLHCG